MNHYAKALSASMLVLLAACSKNQETTPAAGDQAAATPPAVAETPAAPVSNGISSGVLAAYSMPQGLLEDGHCALDGVNGVAPAASVLHPDQDVTFSGWFADAAVQVPTIASLVLRSKAGSYAVPVTAGVERQDVADAVPSESLKFSGFTLSTKLTGVAPGQYDAIVVYGPEGSQSSCPFHATVTVAK